MPGRIKETAIILFCLFHMAAISTYMLPEGITVTTDVIKHSTIGYVRLFSQWQKWDIFSPNPLRRVSNYRIERDAGDRWETAIELSFDALPWWKRAKELKVLGRLEEDRWIVLAEPYLRNYCDNAAVKSSSRIRLIAETRVLPFRLYELEKYANDRTPPTSKTLATFSCLRR